MKIYSKFFIILLFVIQNSFAASKGIWVVRDALTSKKSISKIITSSIELKCDKIFLQFRALGKVYYPTKYDIPYHEVDEELLQLLFDKAKKNNIEVHAWLNVCYIWHKKRNPLPQNHILYKSLSSKIEAPQKKITIEGYYVHPNDNSNLTEIITIIKELFELYKINGVHLDYFRYPKEIYHTSKLARTEYLIKFGLDPQIPLSNPMSFVNERGNGAYIYFQETYNNFLRTELTVALKKIKKQVKAINQDLQLSVAVKPNPIIAKHRYMQDWLYWIENDLCDFVVLMNYSKKMPTFIGNIKTVKEKVAPDRVMIGIATYNINNDEILKRIKFVDESNFSGYALFSYNNIKSNHHLYNLLKQIDK